MVDKEKLEAIQEVLIWVNSGKQSKDNALEEIQYILDGGVVNKNDALHSVSDSVCSNCDGYGYTVDDNGKRKEHCDKC